MEFTPTSAYFQLDSAVYGDILVGRWNIYGYGTFGMAAFANSLQCGAPDNMDLVYDKRGFTASRNDP